MGLSVSGGVHVYFPTFAGAHIAYPGDGQAELSLVVAVIKMHQDDANVTRTANDSHPIQN